MTVYNREVYLASAIESVLAQTFQDFELIVVDDCSVDRSLDVARKYQSDCRLHIYVNDHNLGDYPNRNRAASFASGGYLKYVDADDLIYPHCLEVMMKGMNAWPEAGLGLSWNVIDPPQPYPFVSSSREVLRAHYLGRSVLGVGPTAAIMRRDAFEAMGGFGGRQFVGDDELWLKLAQRWPVVSLPPALVWWRRHEGQQMSLEQTHPDVLNVRYLFELGVLQSCNLLEPDEKDAAMFRLRYQHARRLVSMALRGRQLALARRLWKGAGLGWRDFMIALRPRTELTSNRPLTTDY
jgi:glycosyltransferase involved in cell wall biosynthesis